MVDGRFRITIPAGQTGYCAKVGFAHFGSGMSVGLSGLSAGTAIGIGMDTHATDDLSDRMYLSAACARERDERFRFLLKHLQAIELSLRAFRGHARWFVDAVAGLTDSAQLLGEDLKARP